jgi:hypothetical protein
MILTAFAALSSVVLLTNPPSPAFAGKGVIGQP